MRVQREEVDTGSDIDSSAVSRLRATITGVTTQPGFHVVRESVPWRAGKITECGQPVTEDCAVITAEDLAGRVAAFGAARTGYIVCPDCWATADGAPRWHADPVGVLAREVHSAQARDESGADQLRTELLAIAAVIDAHPVEYGHAVQSFAATVDLGGRRRHR